MPSLLQLSLFFGMRARSFAVTAFAEASAIVVDVVNDIDDADVVVVDVVVDVVDDFIVDCIVNADLEW